MRLGYWVLFQKWGGAVARTSPLLVYRTAALGDFLFAVPALSALREAFPEAPIFLLTTSSTDVTMADHVKSYTGPVGYPWLDFVVPSLINEALVFDGSRAFAELPRLRNELTSRSIKRAIILAHPGEPALSLLKKLLFLRMLGVQAVAGWRGVASIRRFRREQYAAGLFEHKVMGPLRSVGELTGTRPGPPRFPLNLSNEAMQWAEKWLKNCGLSDVSFIVIAAGAIQPHKRWPADRFAEVIRALADVEEEFHFVFMGPQGDAALVEHIVSMLPPACRERVHSMVGAASIPHAAAVLRSARMALANDGGGAHLAAAMGIPVVSLVPGIEYPGSIEPWGWSKYAARNVVPCAPCYSFTSCPQGHNRCMRDIRSDAVIKNCIQAFSEHRKGS